MARSAAKGRRVPPVRAPALTHLALRVHDLPRAVRFYRAVLGMRLAWRERGLAILRAGAFDLALAAERRGGKRLALSSVHFGWRVRSKGEVDRWARRLRAKGVELGSGPFDRDGGRAFYFRDPEGYSLEVYSEWK